MALQFPSLNLGQRKTDAELQAEALKRKQQGQGILSSIGGFFSRAGQRTQPQQIQQPQQSTFQPQVGEFNIPTLSVFQQPQQTPAPQLSTPQPTQEWQLFTPIPQEQLEAMRAKIASQQQVQQQPTQLVAPQASAFAPPQPEALPETPLTPPTDESVARIAALEAALAEAKEQGLTSVENALLEALKRTPEEEQAEKTLANLISSKELGLRDIEEQAIPLDFITGQSAALERRAATQAVPLQAQLANLQAKRQSAIDVATTKLDIEKSRAERAKGEIKEVGGNLVRITPSGVETIFEAAKEAQKPVTVSPGGALVDPTTGKVIFQAPKLPSEAATLKALEKQEKNEEARMSQLQTIGLVSSILDNPQLSRISGSAPGRFLSGAGLAGTAGTRGQVAQLKALTSLEGRNKLKGSGTISDFEAGMLADSANSLNFAIKENGTIAMSDDDARQNLRNIKGILLLKTGQPTPATVTNPETGESLSVSLTREEAEDLWLDGNIINF